MLTYEITKKKAIQEWISGKNYWIITGINNILSNKKCALGQIVYCAINFLAIFSPTLKSAQVRPIPYKPLNWTFFTLFMFCFSLPTFNIVSTQMYTKTKNHEDLGWKTFINLTFCKMKNFLQRIYESLSVFSKRDVNWKK